MSSPRPRQFLPPMDTRERNVARAVLQAARLVREKASERRMVKALEENNAEEAIAALGWEDAEALLESVLPKQYRIAHEQGAEEGQRILNSALKRTRKDVLGIGFDALNMDSARFALKRAGMLIREWGRSSKEALRAMVAKAFEVGIPPRELGKLIVESGIGLTERQALAVVRRRMAMVAQGISPSRVRSVVSRYAQTLLRRRGELIARTEIILASRAGAQETWNQAREQGLLGDTATQTWITTPDERLCPLCEPLDGEEAPLGGSFPGGFHGPPRHPACRCALAVNP